MDGSASPYPTKPLQFLDLKTVALNAQRPAEGLQNPITGQTTIPAHRLRFARLNSPVCVTYQWLLRYSKCPEKTDKRCVETSDVKQAMAESGNGPQTFAACASS